MEPRFGKLNTPLIIQMLTILYQNLDNNGGWVQGVQVHPWETRGTTIPDIMRRIRRIARFRGFIETKNVRRHSYMRITPQGLEYLKYKGYINSDQLEEAKKKLEWNKMLSHPLE